MSPPLKTDRYDHHFIVVGYSTQFSREVRHFQFVTERLLLLFGQVSMHRTSNHPRSRCFGKGQGQNDVIKCLGLPDYKSS